MHLCKARLRRLLEDALHAVVGGKGLAFHDASAASSP